MTDRLIVFDTTLRDGEQSPGASLNEREKVEMALQLARLRVDAIEAGFPVASPGDFSAVKKIAETVRGPVIAALARALEKDIETAARALEGAARPRIHVFLATSGIHRRYKLKKAKGEILKLAEGAVRLARRHVDDVEFSPEDASRTEPLFLAEVVEAVIAAGAGTVNIPDTVGYATPAEFAALIRALRERVPSIAKAVISVHCHNDLGLAVANSLAAIAAGALQVECNVNGIGERAGNASLEEVVMALRTRGAYFECETGVETTEIARTSRLVSTLTGYQIQPNKAIVGRNAFAHESGIHQAGVLSEASTFEIMTPADVGVTDSDIVLGKHSGRHALRAKLAELGYALSDTELDDAFKRFKDVADKKKRVTVLDLEALVNEEMREREDHFTLRSFVNQSGSAIIPTTQVEVLVGGEVKKGRSFSNGSVESVFAAIDDAVGISGSLADYQVRAISSGKDSLAEVRVAVEVNGRPFNGQAVSLDVMEASAKAYVRAVNNAAAAGEV